ncbi:hypothetical protein GALMADRAFT_143708 [Galerina marginata CBS 339.88]|uniref:Uncharacterized protein n=1 Tax=Galerina marginata (strain CBS 339.88) TaxID=685588 RepID=A0A067SKM8_GALM3|nr:hypothetical protein GALMADRAFT_143708 [Galerina marginata CBS 339.88]
MPGPGNRSKSKVKSKASNPPNVSKDSKQGDTSDTGPKASTQPVKMCLTLEEDEMTRCNLPASHGQHRDRCRKHYTQYVGMYKKYKESAKVVDEIRQGASIPTKEEIGRYTEVKRALDKARLVRKFVEAIRVERTGRDLHGRRFFLKIDDGHKMRLKLLEKELVRGVETIDNLQSRAYELHLAKNPRPDWAASPKMSEESQLHAENIIQAAQRMDNTKPMFMEGTDLDDCDLIDVQLRAKKFIMLKVLSAVTDPEVLLQGYTETNPKASSGDISEVALLSQKILYQFALRIVFYEPTLFMKSIGKVSFKDMILSEDFTFEDLTRFVTLFEQRLGFPLLWLKDAVVEALVMTRQGPFGTAANVGKFENRVRMLDGWIFNVAHVKGMSNEVWFRLILFLEPPKDVENRFVRLCNSYNDLVAFLAVGGLGMSPSPSFCMGADLYRRHLSLSGVVVADMISMPKPPFFSGPIATQKKGKKEGCIMWAELESRAYIFGAVKNEPDVFTDAFLQELKSRPDLFHLIIRSETDPEGIVEEFGYQSGALPVARIRTFEAPPASFHNRPSGRGEWTSEFSAKDIFYGTNIGGLQGFFGYLTQLKRGSKRPGNKPTTPFFHFKKFPVKYFAVIDIIPNRHHIFLAQQLSWAALRAQGLGKGEYEERKYAQTSEIFFDKRAAELLAWAPSGWGITKMKV